MKMSLSDLDRSLGKRKTFGTYNKKYGANLSEIDRAVKALGGSLVIEWEPLP